MRLANKVAVITGASRGIGEAIALGYVREGATVVLASRKQEALDEVLSEVEKIGGKGLTIPTHTGDMEQCRTLIQKTVETFGRIDILVNNAATNPHFGPIMDAEAGQWQKILEVNVMGYYWLSRFAAEAMQKQGGGRIINMASTAGLSPAPMMGAYSVSKAAVIMLTRAMAQELGGFNIQVNAIAPGIIKTKFASALWDNEVLAKRYVEQTPAGRIGEPEDVVETAIYLASDGASYLTGEVLRLDGGRSLNSFM
jgi:NAD(P)-dependent dehydrogenase (short-subunit alcohol dehydrogenase family)